MNDIFQRQVFDIIKAPLITDKATRLLETNQYSFMVSPKADKSIIKQSVEEIFKVKVISVNTSHLPRKKRTIGKFKGVRPHFKKAIVQLAEGDTIDLFSEDSN